MTRAEMDERTTKDKQAGAGGKRPKAAAEAQRGGFALADLVATAVLASVITLALVGTLPRAPGLLARWNALGGDAPGSCDASDLWGANEPAAASGGGIDEVLTRVEGVASPLSAGARAARAGPQHAKMTWTELLAGNVGRVPPPPAAGLRFPIDEPATEDPPAEPAPPPAEPLASLLARAFAAEGVRPTAAVARVLAAARALPGPLADVPPHLAMWEAALRAHAQGQAA